MVCPWSLFVHDYCCYSKRVCMFTCDIIMMTGKSGACFRCCSVHPNVQALKDIGSCPWNCVQYQSTTVDYQAVKYIYIYIETWVQCNAGQKCSWKSSAGGSWWEYSFCSTPVCVFARHIRMMTGKSGACFRCCSVLWPTFNIFVWLNEAFARTYGLELSLWSIDYSGSRKSR